ncbi:SnoaL-like domain protein [Variibacter gotjawalensis]|uniref:SnoaL-like domain protein n=2 Tax=Variibacter gotjawalensis TaxID=1333996 RepID=A0A0S3PUP6_9BRAD|nr:SnoaL-like protein [Variibacter gotjawalensis]BAT59681.1 SnoaL-like domain protein [Variibacter gotjawalensis]
MPSRTRVEEFIAVVLSGRHDEAIERFYAEDASMQENLNPPRVGRDLLATQERATMAKYARIDTELRGPIFIEGDIVVINWLFRFTDAEGTSFTIDEIAYQQWQGDLIHRERFYYDPGQVKKK